MTADTTRFWRRTLTAHAVLSRLLIAGAVALPHLAAPVHAQARGGLPVIRDAEIEQLLREYTAPILRAAGLAKQNVRIVLINDRSYNAFVVDGRRIFVNAGALIQIADAEIRSSVCWRMKPGTSRAAIWPRSGKELANVQSAMLLAMLLGLGAAVAGGRGSGDAAAAAVLAPQQIAMRSLLSYQRQQEEQADRAGAEVSGGHWPEPAKGMYETFKRFGEQIMFSAQRADPYVQSHPMPRERVNSLAELVNQQPELGQERPRPRWQARHDLMRAKLRAPSSTRADAIQRAYPPRDMSLPARYARHRAGIATAMSPRAVAQINGLIQSQPSNAYFHELRAGQTLLEAGRPAEAIAPLREAIARARPTLIRVMLGQALIATGNPKLRR